MIWTDRDYMNLYKNLNDYCDAHEITWNTTKDDRVRKCEKENKMPIKTGIDYELKGFTFVPVYKYEVKKIIHSGPCTIVFWEDGTKTVVRLEEGKEYDEYAAFTAALAKKVYGSNSQVHKILEKKTAVEKPKKQKEKESPANVLQTLIDNISEAFDIANREDMTKC